MVLIHLLGLSLRELSVDCLEFLILSLVSVAAVVVAAAAVVVAERQRQ